jgi:predicted TIM-barrel fold metal-dependent hydrolase
MNKTSRRSILSGAAATLAASAARADLAIASSQISLFDSHIHFISGDLRAFPLVPNNQPPPSNIAGLPKPQSTEELLRRLHDDPPTYRNILSLWNRYNVTSGAGVQYTTAYGVDNEYLLKASDLYPDRIAPVISLRANDKNAPDMLRALVSRHQIAGVRLTGPTAGGEYEWLDSSAALEVWAVANDLGLAMVLMYLPPGDSEAALSRIAGVATRFPRTDVVLDHVGWPTIEGPADYGITPAHIALAEQQNTFFKFTTLNLDILKMARISTSGFVRHVVDVYGSNRVMWGSDYGNTKGEYRAMAVRAIAATVALTAPEARQVMHDTGRSVFHRGGRA